MLCGRLFNNCTSQKFRFKAYQFASSLRSYSVRNGLNRPGGYSGVSQELIPVLELVSREEFSHGSKKD